MPQDEKISSTRAETAALAAVLLKLGSRLKEGARVRVRIYNANVVEAFAKKKILWGGREWATLRDRDLWDVVRGVLGASDSWHRVQVVKVAAHQDTRIQKDGQYKGKAKPSSAIDMHEWGNIRADKVVEKMRRARIIASCRAGLLQGDWEDDKGGAPGPARVWIGWGELPATGRISEQVMVEAFKRRLE